MHATIAAHGGQSREDWLLGRLADIQRAADRGWCSNGITHCTVRHWQAIPFIAWVVFGLAEKRNSLEKANG